MTSILKVSAASLFAISALSAIANPTITSPAAGATVSNPFLISAIADTCSGAQVVSMGYSIDSLPNAAVVNGTSIDVQAVATTGNHMVRVKSWGKGVSCTSDVSVTVAPEENSVIPPYAISSGDLDGNTLWKCKHDTGTPGSSTGGITYPLSMSGYTDVQKFEISTYSDRGGERCSVDFVHDPTTHNYIYDVWVMSPSPALVGNLELDMNQVTSNGETVILAFQCSGFKGKWEYSYVSSTGSKAPSPHWAQTALPCNVGKWAPNAWHHVQIYTSRDDSGHVTYHWVALDGVVGELNITTFEEQALHWGIGDTVVNFQLDPALLTGAPVIIYAHDLTIYRW